MGFDFSVLMSVYKKDDSNNLRDSLDSVYNQTFLPEQVVIVEDGNLPSALQEIIFNFQKKKGNIFILKKKNNEGLGLALRDGVKAVKTEWIARMDADDICLSDRFEKQINFLKKHPQLSVLGGQIAEFDKNPKNIIDRRVVPQNYSQILKFSKWRNPMNHMTVMMKTVSVLEAGNYCDIKGFEDYDLWNRMISEGMLMHNLNETLVFARVGNGMYKRRGGIKYLRKYFVLKKRARTLGLVNLGEQLISCLIMFMNIIIPQKLRKIFYNNFLRKDRKV